jgi:hypothetical protein
VGRVSDDRDVLRGERADLLIVDRGTWDAAQLLLTEHANRGSGEKAAGGIRETALPLDRFGRAAKL